MAGCLMLPYFTFPKATEADMVDPNDPTKTIIVPDSGKFLASTYAALNYYDTSSLVGDVFDAVYLLGDQQFVSIDQYKAGRADQKNKAHFLEMLAAMAALEFFNKDSKDKFFEDPKCYMLAMLDKDFSWKDLPPVYPGCDMEGKLKTFIRMAYMYRSMVYPKLDECYRDEEKFKDSLFWRRNDYAPDVFYFNFMGKTGRFIMGNDGEWKIDCEENLDIVFNVSDTSNYIAPYIDKYPDLDRRFSSFLLT